MQDPFIFLALVVASSAPPGASLGEGRFSVRHLLESLLDFTGSGKLAGSTREGDLIGSGFPKELVP